MVEEQRGEAAWTFVPSTCPAPQTSPHTHFGGSDIGGWGSCAVFSPRQVLQGYDGPCRWLGDWG